MGYPVCLDEYTEKALILELTRRPRLQANGMCDYCDRERTAQSCRFPERHNTKEVSPIMQFFLKELPLPRNLREVKDEDYNEAFRIFAEAFANIGKDSK